MIPIWLVRHGEAAAKWAEHPDPGLSDLGRQQAEAAADELEAVIPTNVKLVSSPKARAIETAFPLQQRRELAVEIESAFIEIQAPVTLDQRQIWLRAFMSQRWSEQSAAIWSWREQLVDQLSRLSQPTVVFTHFLVINTVLAHISGDERTVQLWPDNGSIHHLALEAGQLNVLGLGREMTTIVG